MIDYPVSSPSPVQEQRRKPAKAQGDASTRSPDRSIGCCGLEILAFGRECVTAYCSGNRCGGFGGSLLIAVRPGSLIELERLTGDFL